MLGVVDKTRPKRKTLADSSANESIPMASINILECFRILRAIVDAGTITQAARELNLSVAWAARSLERLEAHFGVVLLHRTTRRMKPTDAGQRCYEMACTMLDGLEDLEAELSESADVPRGRVRVSAPMSFSLCELGPILGNFSAAYPEIILDVVLSDHHVNVVEEGFDVVLRITSRPPDSSLLVRRLGTIQRVVCAAPSYLKRHGVPADPEDLQAHKCLVFGLTATSMWRFQGPHGSLKVQPSSQVIANNSLLLRSFLTAGVGVALIPEFIVSEDLRSGAVVKILPGFQTEPLHLLLMRPQDRQPPRRVSLFIDALVDGLGPAQGAPARVAVASL
jgi:DNA-binding transcriptional LysR family regulator